MHQREEYLRYVNAVLGSQDTEEIKKLCNDIYQLGFEDGQEFVYRIRSNDFDYTSNEEGMKIKQEIPEAVITSTVTTNENSSTYVIKSWGY